MTKPTKQTDKARLYGLIDALERRNAAQQEVIEMIALRLCDGDYSVHLDDVIEAVREVTGRKTKEGKHVRL